MKAMKIVVRVPNWIGDAILSLPAIECLRSNFPEAEIWLAAQAWVKDLFPKNGGLSGVITIPALNNIRDLRACGRTLNGYGFEIGVLLTNSFSSALLFRLARIPRRWGYARDARRLLLTESVPGRDSEAALHQLNYYLNLLARLGLKTSPPDINLHLTSEELAAAKKILGEAGVDPGRPLVIFSPGASYGPAKRWPPASFAALGTLFQKKADAQVVLVGSADETGLVESVAAGMEKRPVSFAGKTTLRELAALVASAGLFISNDSGPMHIANAVRVPLVALFGPTDPARTGPFHEPALVLRKEVPCWPCLYRKCPFDHRCLAQITPQEVYEAGQRMIG